MLRRLWCIWACLVLAVLGRRDKEGSQLIMLFRCAASGATCRSCSIYGMQRTSLSSPVFEILLQSYLWDSAAQSTPKYTV